MKFSVAAVLAFAANALAQTSGYLSVAVDSPGTGEVKVTPGTTITWKWNAPAAYVNQQVTIGLIGGEARDRQVPIQTLGTVGTGDGATTTFSWTVPASFGGKPFYGLTFTSVQDPSVYQYSPAFFIDTSAASTAAASTAAATTAAATSAGNSYGTKTISLSSHSAVYTAPAGGYTTIVGVSITTTVPCINGTASATAPYVPPVSTGPSKPYSPPVVSVPVVSVPYKNATFSTAYVPPASTGPSSPYSPPVSTPVATPITGAGARFAAPVAAVAGIFVAAFAL